MCSVSTGYILINSKPYRKVFLGTNDFLIEFGNHTSLHSEIEFVKEMSQFTHKYKVLNEICVQLEYLKGRTLYDYITEERRIGIRIQRNILKIADVLGKKGIITVIVHKAKIG